MGGTQKYRRHPNIWGHPNIHGVSNIWGHPNIKGAIQTYGGIQTYRGYIQAYGGIQIYGAYGHPLSLTKHAFFVLCMYKGASKHHPNIWRASKLMEGVQTYRGHPNILGASNIQGGIQMYGAQGQALVCPNIQGGSQTYGVHPNIQVVSKHVGHPTIQRGVQTCGHSKIQGHPNIQGAIQTYGGIQTYRGYILGYGVIQMYGAYGHPLSLTKHAFYVLCMYRGASKHHPNIWRASKPMEGVQTCRGIQAYRGHPNIQGGIQMYGA